ncbi:MAG: signal peptidase II [Myxococcota bacterium]
MAVLGTKRAAFLPMAFVALAVDQLGKWHTAAVLDPGDRAPLLGDLLTWTNVPAMGGAFGIFRDWLPGAQLIGFSALALAATAMIVFFYRGLAPGEQGSAAALGGLLGGIASHTVDRLRYGSGLDFLHLGPPDANMLPDFSLADVAIVLGVVTLIIELLASEFTARAAERLQR